MPASDTSPIQTTSDGYHVLFSAADTLRLPTLTAKHLTNWGERNESQLLPLLAILIKSMVRRPELAFPDEPFVATRDRLPRHRGDLIAG